jgi:hypothetical protein
MCLQCVMPDPLISRHKYSSTANLGTGVTQMQKVLATDVKHIACLFGLMHGALADLLCRIYM